MIPRPHWPLRTISCLVFTRTLYLRICPRSGCAPSPFPSQARSSAGNLDIASPPDLSLCVPSPVPLRSRHTLSTLRSPAVWGTCRWVLPSECTVGHGLPILSARRPPGRVCYLHQGCLEDFRLQGLSRGPSGEQSSGEILHPGYCVVNGAECGRHLGRCTRRVSALAPGA